MSSSALLETWWEYEKHGAFPYPGGWMDQPLEMLIAFQALSATYHAYRTKNDKHADKAQMGAVQREIIAWIG